MRHDQIGEEPEETAGRGPWLNRRFGLLAAGVLLTAALAIAFLVRGGREPVTSAAPPVVVSADDVAVVEFARIQAGPLLSGTLQPERQATILAQIGGTVVEVAARVGDRVAAGALLARVDDTALEDAYRSAQAAVQGAETSATVAERDMERAETLAAAGAIPTRELEVARTQLASARTQLAQARAQLSSARDNFDAARITAPMAGIVSERRASAGDVVSPGAVLFTVVDPASMELEASIPSQALEQVNVGAVVRFEVRGYPGRMFTGEVQRIAPAVDPVTRQVSLYVSIPNPEGTLVAGLFAEGTVEAVSRGALVVPASAIDELARTPAVVRVRGGTTERVEVRTGIRDSASERVEIVSGIEAGDTLLVGPSRRIAPGTAVEVTAAANPTADDEP